MYCIIKTFKYFGSTVCVCVSLLCMIWQHNVCYLRRNKSYLIPSFIKINCLSHCLDSQGCIMCIMCIISGQAEDRQSPPTATEPAVWSDAFTERDHQVHGVQVSAHCLYNLYYLNFYSNKPPSPNFFHVPNFREK